MSKKLNIQDIVDFITGSDSELPGLSDEEDDELELVEDSRDSSKSKYADSSETDDNASDEDDVPLINLVDKSTAAGSNNNKTACDAFINCTYRWRRQDAPLFRDNFYEYFSDPPEEELAAMQYFNLFLKEDVLKLIVENTNLYSIQRTGISINTNTDEIRSFIGMLTLMGIVQLPTYKLYWSKEMGYPPVADVIPVYRFEKLRSFLHFINSIDLSNIDGNKHFKERPIIEAIRCECVKIEPKEYQAVDEQMIPWKSKRNKIRQYNPKKPKKWGSKNLVCPGNSGMIYDFYIYTGKENTGPEFEGLQKCSVVVASLSKHLHNKSEHKLYFDNWFTNTGFTLLLKIKKRFCCCYHKGKSSS